MNKNTLVLKAGSAIISIALLASIVPSVTFADPGNGNGGNGGNGNAGSVKTVTGSCGAPVNANHYDGGDTVYINVIGLTPNTQLTWTIDQTNGPAHLGAGLTPMTDANGNVCFAALILPTSTSGEFKADVDGAKSDNFSVTAAPVVAPTTGSITINKVVTGTGASATQTFPFTGILGLSTVSQSVPFATSSIAAGTYTVTEGTLPTDWSFTSVVCSGNNATVVDNNAHSAAITLAANDAVTCTFTNNYTAPVVIPGTVDVGVTKAIDDNTPDVAQTVKYTVTVTNTGAVSATNVSVADVLPTDLTFVSASSTAGTSFSGSTWTVGTLAVNATATLEITATVNAETEGNTITNTATATQTETDSDPTNNTAIATANVNTRQTDPNRYTLTVDTSGEGEGIVVGNGINCDSNNPESDCSETYNQGTIVDLTVTPDEGSSFDGSWVAPGAGTCTGTTNPCSVTMNSNINLNAHFTLVTTTTGGGGGGGGGHSHGSGGGSQPQGQVLGAATSTLPIGAPNTGAGGMSDLMTLGAMLALLGGALLGFQTRKAI